ncbi:titin homolog [Ischnura elegans]|uniref:titin homolog n=1 Tax=Ischnura elegans TaxID=197161 RepID=UPI001ED89C6D|nr:titin homolog [Ischnura elegans]
MGKKKSRSKHKNPDRPKDSSNGDLEEPSSDIKEEQDLSHVSAVPMEECAASSISDQKTCPQPSASTDSTGTKEEPLKDSEKMYPLSKATPTVLATETKQGDSKNLLSFNDSHKIADKNDAVLQNLPPSPVNLGNIEPLVTKDESISQSASENQNTKTPDISSGDLASAHALPANVKPNMPDFSHSAMEIKLFPDKNNDPSSNMSPSKCPTTSEKGISSNTLPKNRGNIPQNIVLTESLTSAQTEEVVGDSKKDIEGIELRKAQSDSVPVKDMPGGQIDPNAVKSAGGHTGAKDDKITKQPLQKSSKMVIEESPNSKTDLSLSPSSVQGGEKINNRQDLAKKNPEKENESRLQGKEINLVPPVSSGTDTDGNHLQGHSSAKVDNQNVAKTTDLATAAADKVEGEKVEQLPSMMKTSEGQKKKNEDVMTAVHTSIKVEPIAQAESVTGVSSPMAEAIPNQEDKSTTTANKKNTNPKKKNNKQKTEKSDSSADSKVKGPDSSISKTESNKSHVEENVASALSSIQQDGSKNNTISEEKPEAVQPEVSKESIIAGEKSKSTKLETPVALNQCATTKQELTQENLIPVDKSPVSKEGPSKEDSKPAQLEESKVKESPKDKPTATKVGVPEKDMIPANKPTAEQQDSSRESIFPTEKQAEPKKEASQESKTPADKPADTKGESSKDNVIQEGKPSGKKHESLKKNVKPTGKSAATKMESSKGNAANAEKHAGKKQEAPRKNANSDDIPTNTNQETSKQEKVAPVDKSTSKTLEGSEESITLETPVTSQQEVSKEMAKSPETQAENKNEASKESVVTDVRPAVAQQEGPKEVVIPAEKPTETKKEISNEKGVLTDVLAASPQETTKEITSPADQSAKNKLEASKENTIGQDKIATNQQEPSKENVKMQEKIAAKEQKPSKENVNQGGKPGTKKQETPKKNMAPTDRPAAKKQETMKKNEVPEAEKQEGKKEETSKKDEISAEKPEASHDNVIPAKKPAGKKQESPKGKVIQEDKHTSEADVAKENVIKEETTAVEIQGNLRESVTPADTTSTAKPGALKGNVDPVEKPATKKQEASKKNTALEEKPEATKEKVLEGEKPTVIQMQTSKETPSKGENPSAKKQEASQENLTPVEKAALAKHEASKETVIQGENTTAMQASKEDVIKEGKVAEEKLDKENKNQAEKPQEASNRNSIGNVQGEKQMAMKQETSQENLVQAEKTSGKKQDVSKENKIPEDKPIATKPEEPVAKHKTAKQEAAVEKMTHAEKSTPKQQVSSKKNATQAEKSAANKQVTSQEKIQTGKPGVKQEGELKGNVMSAEKPAATKEQEQTKTKKEESKEEIQVEKPAQKQQEASNNAVEGENPSETKKEKSNENMVPVEKPAGKKQEESKDKVNPAAKPAAAKPKEHAAAKQEAPKENVIPAEKPTTKQQVVLKKDSTQKESKGNLTPAEKPTTTKQVASKTNVIPPVKPATTKQETSSEKLISAEKQTAKKQGEVKENVIPAEKPAATKQESSKKDVNATEKSAATKQETSMDNVAPSDKPAVLKQEPSKKNVVQPEKLPTTKQETTKKNAVPAEKLTTPTQETSKKSVIPGEKPATTKQETTKNVTSTEKAANKKEEASKKAVKPEEKPAATKQEVSKERVILGEKSTPTQEQGPKKIKAENPAGTKQVTSKENLIQGDKEGIPSKANPASQIPSTNSPKGKDQSSRESHVNEGVSTKSTQIAVKTEMGPDTPKEAQLGAKSKSAANDPSSVSDKKKRKENKKQVIPSKTGEVQSPEDRKSNPVPEGEPVPISNERKSSEAVQKTSAHGDATSKGLEKLFIRNDDETFQARPIFMANACHVCKCTHGGETRLKSCSACRLIAYCSKEHQRMHWKEHKPLCQQVQKRIKKSGLQDLYGDAHKITDAEEWRKYRCFHIVDIEKRMGRPLLPFEREMFLYPRVCTVCYKSDPEKLKVCKGCHFINYCSAGHLPISHKVWCKDLKMLLQINQYQSKYGLLRPQIPSINLDFSKPFPKSMKDFFSASLVNDRNSSHFSMYECILSDVATCPLTICHVFNLLNGVNQSNIPKNLTIHLVGAENQFEVEPLSKWDAFLLNLLPQVEKVHLVFVGPELEPTSLDDINDNGYQTQEIKTFNSSKKLTAEFYYGQLYHDYVNASSFVKPDLICAFNCGIYRFTGYNNKDTWGPTIASMVKDTNIPILLTAYTEVEAPKDVARFKKQCSCNELISPMKNPFASMRPNLNFVSDDETPLIYKNQYLSVVKGCDK